MKQTERIAVFIDLANSADLDFRSIMKEASEAGFVEEARCYGDFRQAHLVDVALDLYALGISMVHCPSWKNGNDTMKRSDDRLLEKGIRDTLEKRQSISTYLVVTSDSDIIPTCHSVLEQKKHLILYSSMDHILGRILRQCGFDVRQAPKAVGRLGVQTHQQGGPRNEAANATDRETQHSGNGELNQEHIIRQIDRLEKTSRYLTFMQTVGRIANGNGATMEKLRQYLSHFIEHGMVEQYEQHIPAIRLNRENPYVVSALAETNESRPDAVRSEGLLAVSRF